MRGARAGLAAVLVVGALAIGAQVDPAAEAQASPAAPNFVFILADDMTKNDLAYMPKTRRALGKLGMTFRNAFVSNPLCCPSRATIMRGQYAHNTGVWSNRLDDEAGPHAYTHLGHELDNLATRLDAAGYRTALVGKYLNSVHPQGREYVPPGWDRWFGTFSFNYYDYQVNANGRLLHFGKTERDYLTDVLKRRTKGVIETAARRREAFFVYVAPTAPHAPATAAKRHLDAFASITAPRTPSFNEEDVSDKPPYIAARPVMTDEQIAGVDRRHRKRSETLLALDGLVHGVVRQLEASEVLDNTYVVFTSDNGWAEGQHRRPKGKANPYEEDIRVPLLVRGPGVAASSVAHELTLNTDFLPTFTDLAGIATPEYVDGRSLRPLLEGEPSPPWRDAILIEGRTGPWRFAAPTFSGIRTAGEKYIEYESGFREFYDLTLDPYELDNAYDPTVPPASLQTRLDALRDCAAAQCRSAEGDL